MSRKIDALIAEHVMGLGVFKSGDGDYFINRTFEDVPKYSTDIAAAWEVVENLKMFGDDKRYLTRDEFDGGWSVYERFYSDNLQVSNAKTASLAICLAALKAKNIEPPSEDDNETP